VLYARLPFCDPGAYDAMAARALADEGGLPFLELEIDYPLEIDGRLRVRIEAFLETLTLTDPMLDDKDDLFGDDPPPLDGPAGGPVSDCVPQTPGQARGNGNKAGNGGSTLLAASLTRRVLAAKTSAAAFQSGTARSYLEHYALSAALYLYKPGAFVPWVSYLFPPEILASFNLTPLIPEVAAATLSGTDFRDDLETAMNRQPLSRDICSYHRAAKAASPMRRAAASA